MKKIKADLIKSIEINKFIFYQLGIDKQAIPGIEKSCLSLSVSDFDNKNMDERIRYFRLVGWRNEVAYVEPDIEGKYDIIFKFPLGMNQENMREWIAQAGNIFERNLVRVAVLDQGGDTAGEFKRPYSKYISKKYSQKTPIKYKTYACPLPYGSSKDSKTKKQWYVRRDCWIKERYGLLKDDVNQDVVCEKIKYELETFSLDKFGSWPDMKFDKIGKKSPSKESRDPRKLSVETIQRIIYSKLSS